MASSSKPGASAMNSPVCFSALYFMNLRGEVLMERQYRDDVTRQMAGAFKTEILNGGKDRGNVPVVNVGACSFMYRRERDVYVVAVTRQNANAMLAFTFLEQLGVLFKSYFGTFSEASLKQNFVIIYELLDEILDNGFPQITAPAVLQSYITQKSIKSLLEGEENGRAKGGFNSGEDRARQVAMQVTGAVQWRPPGVAYKKNEVYLDIVESVSLLMSHEGAVLRSSATGVIQMRCLLSGMPELKIGLNDTLGMGGANQAREASGPRGEGGPSSGGGDGDAPRSSAGGARAGRKQIELADLQFHQCVNLSKFSAERTISFVPPDGEFELMKYRVTEAVSLPFKVMPMVKELGRTRMEVRVRVKACFPETQMALGVKLRIPVPRHTSRATCKGTAGKCKYKQAENALVWKIKRFQGGCELSLHAEVDLISTTEEKKKWTQPPLSMDFSVPMFTASGLRVRFLKVWEKSGYQSTKWVRYLCNSGAESKGGTYEIRCQ